jgi:hypothetical protein
MHGEGGGEEERGGMLASKMLTHRRVTYSCGIRAVEHSTNETHHISPHSVLRAIISTAVTRRCHQNSTKHAARNGGTRDQTWSRRLEVGER